jgi:hypothetical protein
MGEANIVPVRMLRKAAKLFEGTEMPFCCMAAMVNAQARALSLGGVPSHLVSIRMPSSLKRLKA